MPLFDRSRKRPAKMRYFGQTPGERSGHPQPRHSATRTALSSGEVLQGVEVPQHLPLEIRLELPARLDMLRPLHAFVGELLASMGPRFAGKPSDDICLVMHEAFTNICRHAYGQGNGGLAVVTMSLSDDRVQMVLEDEGTPFDIEGWTEPDLDDLLESGRGVWLMKHLMQEFSYESTPEGRNVLKLVRNLQVEAQSVDDAGGANRDY
jgi:serine/threonine-protein kinase RsbW